MVGGFLRDQLLGVPGKDLDIAIAGDPLSLGQELARTLHGSFVPLSAPHQMARVIVPSHENGSWVLDLSPLHGSIEKDLARRDFTIDALALPLAEWGQAPPLSSIIDPFGGLDDLHHRTIRALGPNVFQDDPARLIRAVRLVAHLGFSLDSSTRHQVIQQAHLLGSVAAERAREEFLAILSTNGAKQYLLLLDELGLLCATIPQLQHTKGVEQPREHYWDVFNHSLETVERAERVTSEQWQCPAPNIVPWDESTKSYFTQEAGDGHSRRTMLKLAALLHDIGKPQTKTVDPDGRTRFFGHPDLGAEVTVTIMGRLRCSSRSTGLVASMVRHHLRPSQMSQGVDLPTPRAIYRFFRDLDHAAVDTLYLSLADYLAARGPEVDVLDWRLQARRVAHILELHSAQGSAQKSHPLVNGHDLMAQFNLPPGPLLGRLLETIREAVATGDVQSREQALDLATRTLASIRCNKTGL